MVGISCRFYKPKFPEVEEVIMVNVRSVALMGAYASLLEYNNIEGMILLSELSRRRIRSVNKLIRVGKSECVVVIRVDKDKGYIDLSKRRVSPEDITKCNEKFARGKCVNSILRHVAEILEFKTDEELEDLYEKTAWHFDAKLGKPGACYEVLKNAVQDPAVLDECDIDAKTKEILVNEIKRRLTPQAVKIRADVEVSCYEYEGIDAVKRALKAGLSCCTEDSQIKCNLIAPPIYVFTMTTLERNEGLELLNQAIERVREAIVAAGGSFNIKLAPKVVTLTDEDDLAKQMEEAERENAQVEGDDDNSDEEDEDDDEKASGDEDVEMNGDVEEE